jgi:quercetin dioxygenase-like cupin family protein
MTSIRPRIRPSAAIVLFGTGLFLSAMVSPSAAQAPESAVSVEALFSRTLADRGERELVVVEVTFTPGAGSDAHRHPGRTFVYVLDGAVRSQLDDGPVSTYRAGEWFYKPPMSLYATAHNASDTDPAHLIAFMILEPDKPVVIPEP